MKSTLEVRVDRLELDLRAAKSAADALKRRLDKANDDLSRQRPQFSGGAGGGWCGQTTGAIAGMTTNKWPGGSVKLGTLALASPTDTDPTFTDSGADPVTAYNLTGNTIPSGKNVAGITIGPYRVITTANCINPTVADPAPAAQPAAVTTSTTSVSDGNGQAVVAS